MNTHIKCGQCKGYHGTIQEVKDCHMLGQPVTKEEVDRLRPSVAAVAERHMSAPATERQLGFLKSLLAERPTWTAARITGELGMWLATLTKGEASDTIAKAKAVPKEVTAGAPAGDLPDVPEGYYAVPSRTGNNDLDFFRVDRPTKGAWSGRTFVKRVIGGHSDTNVPLAQVRQALQSILDFGVEASRLRYATELGRCYVCNLHLTDELSRQLGIGPVCRAK